LNFGRDVSIFYFSKYLRNSFLILTDVFPNTTPRDDITSEMTKIKQICNGFIQ
jgi:hypothetical protein